MHQNARLKHFGIYRDVCHADHGIILKSMSANIWIFKYNVIQYFQYGHYFSVFKILKAGKSTYYFSKYWKYISENIRKSKHNRPMKLPL
jgi:hypothetical protein